MATTDQGKQIAQVPEQAQNEARKQTLPPIERRRRSYLFILLLAALAVGFGILTFFVKTIHSFPLDLVITRDIQSQTSPPFNALMVAISWLGFFPQSVFVSLIIVIVILFFGLQWEALSAILSAILAGLVNVIVKDLIQRPRPAASLVHVLARLTDYSFPSGHVMFYLGFFGFIGFLAYTLLKPSRIRNTILFIVGFLVGLVGISRIYEGEHWASDVLGAYLLGTLVLIGAIAIYRWGKPRFFVHQPVAKPDQVKSNN